MTPLRLLAVLLVVLAATATAAAAELARPAQAESLWQAYQAGRYYYVGQQAFAFLKQASPDDELRLALANSLAWTGETAAALRQYELLDGSAYTREALLGRANVYRWSGRPDLAAPLYRRYLEQDPHHDEARTGLLFAERELAARSQYRVGRIVDSADVARPWQTLGHRWRSADQLEFYEVEVGVEDDHRNDLHYSQREALVRYENLKLPLQPWLELSAQTTPETKPFALARVTLDERPSHLYLGHVNWGKLAFTPEALGAELTAQRVGADTAFTTSVGQWRLAYDYYDISDGNTIQEPRLRYTPAWQPFPTPDMRWFLGINTRIAKRNSPLYWSPADDYYNWHIGFETEWVTRNFESSLYGIRGFRLSGEARNTWSAGAGIKRWFGGWAIGANIWAMSDWRDDTSYRSQSWTGVVEKRW